MQKNKFKVIKSFLLYILVWLIIFINTSTVWVMKNYGNITFDEILFHIFGPLDGSASNFVVSFILESVIVSIILSVFLYFGFILLFRYLKGYNYKLDIRVWSHKSNFTFSDSRLVKIVKLSLILLSITTLYYCSYKVQFTAYCKTQMVESSFIEENYVEPKDVKLTFPEKDRNLIYILVESLESTHFSKDLGGSNSTNLMPELSQLSLENITFSNTDTLGGALPVTGTTWTSAAMISQTAGIPIKFSPELTNNDTLATYVPGAYSIGQILAERGYNQMLMFGSAKEFGNRGLYFKTHGNYEIYDLQTAKDKGKISQDYKVWWGFEDSKLFEYAKEEIINLANKNKPFNFTMLTANTHNVGGYLEDYCETPYSEQLRNVLACTSKQLDEFIRWIKEQDFYENTTIVLVGDHLSMEADYFDYLDADYQRTIYNLFINSAVETENTKNREFSTLDLYPTTLASLGIEIEGNKMALGTNLFSDEKTLIEKYDYNFINNELAIKSKFYNKNIVYSNLNNK